MASNGRFSAVSVASSRPSNRLADCSSLFCCPRGGQILPDLNQIQTSPGHSTHDVTLAETLATWPARSFNQFHAGVTCSPEIG